MTWDTFLTLRGPKGIYLDHVCTLRPSKSYGWGAWAVVVLVVHKILVTSPEAKFLFPFLGLLGLWALDWDLASGLSIQDHASRSRLTSSLMPGIYCLGER